jgi:biopolymer transport protein ExbD
VSLDSTDNQLKDWIYARIANIEVNDELQIAIKGDAKEEYPAIRKVMDILSIRKSIVLVWLLV